jgi:hypothetical protein
VSAITPLDAARAILDLCRLLWLRRARDEERGVLLQGSPRLLRDAAARLAEAVAEAEAHPDDSDDRRAALGRAAEAIDGISQALIPSDGISALLELSAQMVRGMRNTTPTAARRFGQ